MESGFRFIDLFCGIGGFHQAMSNIGGTCVYACDIDAQCRKTYGMNYGITPDSDITKVDCNAIPSHDVLCAGFPCQAFSVAGFRKGFADSTKGTLFFDVLRILKHHKPPYALLENVSYLKSHDHGRTWKVIYQALEEAGYNVSQNPITFSPHYIGVPQDRVRVFIMCVRKDIGEIPEFCFNKDNIPECDVEKILLDDSEINNPDDFKLTSDQIEWINIWNDFIRMQPEEKNPTFPIWADSFCPVKENHRITEHTAKSQWVIDMIHRNSEYWNRNREFCDQWIEKAKEVKLFYGAKAKLEWQAGENASRDVWNKILQIRPSGLRVKNPAYFPTLVTIPTQVPIIAKRKRFITPRECARLQSFPDSFKITESRPQAYKQFGNSVNVAVVELFAKFLLGDAEVRHQYSFENQYKDNHFSEKQ